jgi:AraC-like DNA-binding protein
VDVLCIDCTGGGLPMQAREELTLVLSRSGAVMLDPQGRAHRVGPDDVGVARPGEMYAIETTHAGGSVQVLLAAPEMLAPPAGSLVAPVVAEPIRFRTPAVRDARLAARLHALFGELRRGLTTLDALARFRAALQDLAERHLGTTDPREAARRTHPGAARAHAYVREHFAERVPLETLASVSRLGRCYLLRVFRRDYGVTPHEYQRQLRLAHACRLLAGGAPPCAAAFAAGLSDQSHLTRLLKRSTGLTPGAFARQFAGLSGVQPSAPVQFDAPLGHSSHARVCLGPGAPVSPAIHAG